MSASTAINDNPDEAVIERRPTVLVDMDGPLADFDAAFYALCHASGWEMHSTLQTQCHRFATDCILDRKHARLAREFVNSSRWFLDLPVTTGAIDGINELAEHADVWICTKPLEANLQCRDDKASWVRRVLGEEWERRLILTPDKSLVRGDILLDDAIKLHWLNTAEWEPVVFPTPWNGCGSDWDGLRSWKWGDPIADLLDNGHAETPGSSDQNGSDRS